MCPTPKEYRPCSPGCKDTCDGKGKDIDYKCDSYFIEGCYCPEGMIEDGKCGHPRQ